jgi:para-nitrobenzyl esterase
MFDGESAWKQSDPLRSKSSPVMRFGFLCLTIPMLLLQSARPQHVERKGPLVHLASGTLEGYMSGEIAVFKGIPFAKPPIGPSRWREPQPVAPWSGIRDATKPSRPCMQSLQGVDSFVQPLAATYGVSYSLQQLDPSEDCLYLNVWTPQLQPAMRLPVMVWLGPVAARNQPTTEPH